MNGVLYIAFGESYQEEVRRSLKSLKSCSPAIKSAVITDQPWSTSPQPDMFVVREAEFSFRSKPKYINDTPFERTLLLDTDTVVAKPIDSLFKLLDYYDIGLTMQSVRSDDPYGLDCHPQCNSGVILFKKNERVERFFSKWLQEYDNSCGKGMDPNSEIPGKGVPDQPSLKASLIGSDARVVHLPTFVHCILQYPAITYSPPMIYHGRIAHMEMLDEEIENRFKQVWGWHVWLPNIRGFLPAGVRRSDPALAAGLIFQRIFNTSRRRLRSWLSK
jgi:hypothetical protein